MLNRKISIGKVVIPAIVITASIVLGCFGYYSYVSSKERLIDNEERNINGAVSRLTISLVTPLWDLNTKSADEFITAELTTREIIGIAIYDSDNKLFASKGLGKIEDKEMITIDEPHVSGHPKKMFDITKDGSKIGHVEAYYTTEYSERALKALLVSTISQVFLTDLSIIAVLIVLMRIIVTRPLNKVVESLTEISEGDGDLTVALGEQGAKEISQLASAFNVFVNKTRSVVDKAKQVNIEMVAAVEELSATTIGIAKSNESVSHQTNQLASAVEEMNVTIEHVEKDCIHVIKISETTKETASNSIDKIIQGVDSVNEISKVVNNSVDTVKELSEESVKIRMVVGVINKIAEQTNLLALNAAIEAARAGEYGRGFSVVADEVRELAKNTVEATTEVSNIVTSIQSKSVKAVEVMECGNQAVENLVMLSEQTRRAVQDIDVAVNSSTEQTNNIAIATKQIASTIREMSRNTDQIAGAVENNSMAADGIAQTSSSIAKQADSLRKIMSGFKT